MRKIAADEGGGSQVVVDTVKARKRAAEAEKARLAGGAGAGAGWMMKAVEDVTVANEKVETKKVEAGIQDEEMQDFGGSNTSVAPEKSHEIVDHNDSQGTTSKSTRQASSAHERLRLAAASQRTWQWIYHGLPDPNLKTITARPSTIKHILYTPDNSPAVHAKSLAYRSVTRYVVQGYQWVHGNIVLFLYRLLRPPPSTRVSEEEAYNAATMTREGIEACKLLDCSGAWVLEAKILVDGGAAGDGLNEVMSRATRELMAMRDSMRGCLDLRAVDRLSVDTRAK